MVRGLQRVLRKCASHSAKAAKASVSMRRVSLRTYATITRHQASTVRKNKRFYEAHTKITLQNILLSKAITLGFD